jgi:hypothetical protein
MLGIVELARCSGVDRSPRRRSSRRTRKDRLRWGHCFIPAPVALAGADHEPEFASDTMLTLNAIVASRDRRQPICVLLYVVLIAFSGKDQGKMGQYHLDTGLSRTDVPSSVLKHRAYRGLVERAKPQDAAAVADRFGGKQLPMGSRR